MNFNDYQNQLNKASKAPSLFTGITNVKVLGINPTQEQLAEILGDADKASKFNTDYNKGESYNGDTVRPVCIWVTDYEENVSPTLFTIELGDKEHLAQSGSKRIINNYLQTTWSNSVASVTSNEKMSWFSDTGIRVARIGEVNYYTFIATLVRYDLQGEKSFNNFLTDNKLDFDSVYEGNFEGLRGLVNFANNNDMVLAMPFIVRKKEDENGVVFRQQVLSNPEVWYRSTIDGDIDWVVNNFKEKCLAKDAEGYPITQKLYTYEFTKFSEDKCVNAEPENNAEASSVGSWT